MSKDEETKLGNEKARLLEAVRRGHSYRVEVIDPLWFHGRFRWERLLPWIGDRIRQLRMHIRIRWDDLLRRPKP